MTAGYDDLRREELAVPHSRKWSLHPDAIGAWVAETDFGTAPVVTEALQHAIATGHLGYLSAPTSERMGRATAAWHAAEYGWDLDWRRVHPVSDVMSAYAVAIERYSRPGSAVIVPTPAYMPFLSFTPTLDREVVQVPGLVDAHGRWSHDLEAIDRAFAAGAGTLVLCNPHNPTGRVLDREELEAIAEVVERHRGRVFADEIHAPLRFDGVAHLPYAAISAATAGHTITATSASKAWNVPGLKTAQLITSNDDDERRYAEFAFSVLHGASTPGAVAASAAYESGAGWVAEQVAYLEGSRALLAELVAEHLPLARWSAPEATYLAWLDLRAYAVEGPLDAFFRERAGVALTDGALCGAAGEGFVRIVFATPRPILVEIVQRMGAALAAR